MRIVIFVVLITTSFMLSSQTLTFKCGTEMGDREQLIEDCLMAARAANNSKYSDEFIVKYCHCIFDIISELFTFKDYEDYTSEYGNDVIPKLLANNVNGFSDKFLDCSVSTLLEDSNVHFLENASREDLIDACITECKNNPSLADKSLPDFCVCMIDYIRKNGIQPSELKYPNSRIYTLILNECE